MKTKHSQILNEWQENTVFEYISFQYRQNNILLEYILFFSNPEKLHCLRKRRESS